MIRHLILFLIFSVLFSNPLTLSTRSISFPNPVASDLDDGYIISSAVLNIPDIVLLTNYGYKADWIIYIAATDLVFSSVNNDKYSSDLLWKLSSDPDSKYRAVSESPDILFSGYGSRQIEINFKLLLDWVDRPDNYLIDIIFYIDEKTSDKMIKTKDRTIDK